MIKDSAELKKVVRVRLLRPRSSRLIVEASNLVRQYLRMLYFKGRERSSEKNKKVAIHAGKSIHDHYFAGDA